MKTKTKTLTPELLHKTDAWWRAANHLSIDQIYLHANPLLKKPLKLAHIKPRRFSHWGTTPGLNFIYVHLMIFPPGGVIPYSRAPIQVVA